MSREERIYFGANKDVKCKKILKNIYTKSTASLDVLWSTEGNFKKLHICAFSQKLREFGAFCINRLVASRATLIPHPDLILTR